MLREEVAVQCVRMATALRTVTADFMICGFHPSEELEGEHRGKRT